MRNGCETFCGAWYLGLAATVVLVALGIARPVLAQQDMTPPVILDFSVSPVVVDTGEAPADITVCARAADYLSGTAHIAVLASCTHNGPACSGGAAFIYPPSHGVVGPLDGCATMTLARYSRYDTLYLHAYAYDTAGNHRDYNSGIGSEDLCVLGPCHIENRPTLGVDDRDADDAPDDADNCPDLANPDQADSDVDLIGDACDPFPDDRDNEQAQCEADLGQSTRDAKQAARKLERVRGELAAERVDTDGDGVRDAADDCPSTPISAEVDKGGCSLAQFCARVDATTSTGRKACKRSDWRNDEPLMNLLTEADCSVEGGLTADSADDRCASVTP